MEPTLLALSKDILLIGMVQAILIPIGDISLRLLWT